MKAAFTLLSVFCITRFSAQTDTMIWDASKLELADQKYEDGYHIFKKNGIIIKEFKLLNGKTSGVCREYYNNGKPKLEYEIIHPYPYSYSYTGPYCEYYESGKIKTDGAYAWADSIECIGCYDVDRHRIVTRTLFSRSERKGEWQEFYESGRLKAVGRYKGMHETHHVAWPKPSGLGGPGVFTPGDLSEEHLKDELWKYYDQQGRQVKEEYYYKGMLASEETWVY